MDIFGFKSKSDLRRAVNENSLTINKVKITNIGHKILKSDLLHDKFLFVEYGKKLKLILDLSNCQFIES